MDGRAVPWRVAALALAGFTGVAGALLFLRYTGTNGLGGLDWFRAVLVCFATMWIAWGAAQGLIGLLPRRSPVEADGDEPIEERTAILVPVYNEDPVATFARVAAMDDGLRRAGVAEMFDFVVLSDTTDEAVAAAERAMLARFVSDRGGPERIYYRRRMQNTGKKAGNIEDFVRKSGGAYAFALILDADSLMEADTILRMVRRMQADAGLGLLQSLPSIVNARTRFGRAMQFAAGFYSPVFARGVERLQGWSGPFWGHNALVRMSAFAESCGLPQLSGPPPFGGHILSHDYVEAALLARAGWRVEVSTDLAGSFEEGPENVIAYAKRDRRWCQGNLQHSRLVSAPGLRWWSRFVFVQGIASYVAPILWGAFILASLVAASTATPPNYFPLPGFSVPIFPDEHLAAAISLLVGVFGLLLVPKFLIWVTATVSGRAAGFGGPLRTLTSVVGEIALSSVLAPLLMMFQCRSVFQVLFGRDAGWPASDRDDGRIGFAEAWIATWWMTLTGLGVVALASWLAPELLVWLLPVAGPLILAPGLAVWTSQPEPGPLFATPAETAGPDVLATYRAYRDRWQPRADDAPDRTRGRADAAPAAI